MKNVFVPKVTNLNKALQVEYAIALILRSGCMPTEIENYSTQCNDVSSRGCNECILHKSNQGEFMAYLIENNYITKGKALQLTLEDANK